MLPEIHPLIDAATKPLADNAEQRLAANALLAETFDPVHPDVAETMGRFLKADSKRRARIWRIALHICAGVSICLLIFSVQSIRSGLQALSLVSSFGSFDEPKIGFPERLTPTQRLLLGDSALPALRQKELLQQSSPDRPDFYSEYAWAYWREHSDLPPGYMETVARIDPENSFFPYIAAGSKGGDSVEKVKSPAGVSAPARFQDGKRLKAIPVEIEWAVTDQAEFDSAMQLISQASALPRFETYEQSMGAARLGLLGQDTVLERIRTLAFMAGQTTQIIAIRKVSDLFCAKAYLLSLSGDKEGFTALAGNLEKFLAQVSVCPDSSLIAELVFSVNAASTANSFHFAAGRLGLADLAEKYRSRKMAFLAESDQRQLRDDDEEYLRFEKEASVISSLSVPMIGRQVLDPPQISAEDLAPGRFADHDFLASFSAGFAAFAMGLVALAVFQLRYRASRSMRALATRFNLLLTPCDWAWILSCGVVVPVAAVVMMNRFTPLGGRDYGIRHQLFLFPPAHYALIVLLAITLPLFLIQWRLGRRLAAFRLGFRIGRKIMIIPALGSIAMLFAVPLLNALPPSQVSLGAVAFVPALWALGILFAAALVLFGKPAHRLRRVICLQAMAPACSLAVVLLALLHPVFRASADRWVARDDFGRVVSNGLCAFESEVAVQKRKEVKAILGFK